MGKSSGISIFEERSEGREERATARPPARFAQTLRQQANLKEHSPEYLYMADVARFNHNDKLRKKRGISRRKLARPGKYPLFSYLLY